MSFGFTATPFGNNNFLSDNLASYYPDTHILLRFLLNSINSDTINGIGLILGGISIPILAFYQIGSGSFSDLLKNESNTTFRDAVYYHYFEFPYWHHVQPHYGIRTNKFKLIHFYYSLNEWEFFDLENDPNELNYLIENPAYEEVIKKLKVRLDELKKEYKIDLSTDELRKMTDIRINRRYRVEPANYFF